VSHPAGSDDVAGPVVLEAHDLAVDQLVESGWLVWSDFLRELVDMHFFEKEILQPMCRDETLSRIVGKIVGNFRSVQAQAVLEFPREGDAIVEIRGLLDEEADAKLTCELFIQLVGQRLAEQRLIAERGVASLGWRVKPALVQTVDEVERCHVGIAAHAADYEIPALVADIAAECGPFVAEWSIAQIADTRRDQWSAIRIYRCPRQTPDNVIGVIHQIAPDHVASVCNAVGCPAAIFRHQQQSRRFDCMCRNDIDLGLYAAGGPRPSVPYEIDLADASIFTNYDLAGDVAIQYLYVSGFYSVIQGDSWIVFRLDRTDRNAVRVAGAGAAILVGLRIARGRKRPDRNAGWRLFHFQESGLVFAQ